MPKTVRNGPAVRGLCPAGHLVEGKAAKGRVTWRGTCPHDLGDGKLCGLAVVCKRIPGNPDPPIGPLEPVPAGRSPKSIRKVAGYVNNDADPAHPADPGYEPPAPADEPDGPDARVRVPAPPADDGSADTGGDDDHQGDRPRGLFGRLRAGRTRRTGEWDDEREDWTAPGIFR